MTKEQRQRYKNNYIAKNEKRFKENRRKYNKQYYARTRKYQYSNWTEEMDRLVLEHKITDTEISKLISKSVMAIQVRRWRLKKYEK